MIHNMTDDASSNKQNQTMTSQIIYSWRSKAEICYKEVGLLPFISTCKLYQVTWEKIHVRVWPERFSI